MELTPTAEAVLSLVVMVAFYALVWATEKTNPIAEQEETDEREVAPAGQ